MVILISALPMTEHVYAMHLGALKCQGLWSQGLTNPQAGEAVELSNSPNCKDSSNRKLQGAFDPEPRRKLRWRLGCLSPQRSPVMFRVWDC